MYQSLCDFSSPLTIYLMSDDLCCQEISSHVLIFSTCSQNLFCYLFMLYTNHYLQEHSYQISLESLVGQLLISQITHILVLPKMNAPHFTICQFSPPPTPQYLSVSWFCKGLLQNQYRSPNDEAIERSDKTNTSGLGGKRWWCTQSD